jgi:hypothetical protein
MTEAGGHSRRSGCVVAKPIAITAERAFTSGAMNFWSPNIDRAGRIFRGLMAVILFVAAFFAHRKGIEWLAAILAIAALFGAVEAARGWCVLRACKIKTRF